MFLACLFIAMLQLITFDLLNKVLGLVVIVCGMETSCKIIGSCISRYLGQDVSATPSVQNVIMVGLFQVIWTCLKWSWRYWRHIVLFIQYSGSLSILLLIVKCLTVHSHEDTLVESFVKLLEVMKSTNIEQTAIWRLPCQKSAYTSVFGTLTFDNLNDYIDCAQNMYCQYTPGTLNFYICGGNYYTLFQVYLLSHNSLEQLLTEMCEKICLLLFFAWIVCILLKLGHVSTKALSTSNQKSV